MSGNVVMALVMALVAAVLPSFAGNTSVPEQVHLAFGGAPTEMVVNFYTEDKVVAFVEYRLASDAAGSWSSALATELPEYAKGYGHHHTVTLTNLLPGRIAYAYRAGTVATHNRTEEFHFRTQPLPGTMSTFNVSILADWGWKDSTERPMYIAVGGLESHWSAQYTRDALTKLYRDGLDFVLHGGDIAYVDDAFASAVGTFNYEPVYNGFMNWIEPIAANIPYMVTQGNHESECHGVWCDVELSFGRQFSNFSAYNTRWNMPSWASNGALNMWYSYDYGQVHFVSTNSETDFKGADEEFYGSARFPAGGFGRPGEYLRWLENDLRVASQRQDIKWIVAIGHRPMEGPEADAHAALFTKYGVDIYFCGHLHWYRRRLPMSIDSSGPAIPVFDRSQEPHLYKNASGFIEIVVGGAGCDEMPDADEDGIYHGLQQIEGIVYETSRYASGVLSVSPEGLVWRLIDSKTMQVLDTVALIA